MKLASASRRDFLKTTAACAVGGSLVTLTGCTKAPSAAPTPLFTISLAEWSLNRAIKKGELDNLDFPKVAKQDYGIDAVEYVNQLFMDKGGDKAYFAELKKRADDNGVSSVLIMCDREGDLGDPDEAKRKQAVENHYKWAEGAKLLGCHAIRVNAKSDDKLSAEEQSKLAADGLRRLSEFGATLGLSVIVENHGGLSSNGEWLASTIREVNLPNCGTLPDFGNFRIKPGEEYDCYQGVAEMMPFAKGVSAKTYDFDDQGNETKIDYRKMMKIVLDAGYRGRVGVEYEGNRLSEPEGIKATKLLLEKVRDELADSYPGRQTTTG